MWIVGAFWSFLKKLISSILLICFLALIRKYGNLRFFKKQTTKKTGNCKNANSEATKCLNPASNGG